MPCNALLYTEKVHSKTDDIAESEVTKITVIDKNAEEEQDIQLQDIVMDVITDPDGQRVSEDMANGAQVEAEVTDSTAQVVTETMDDGAQEVTDQEQLEIEVLDAEKSLQLFAALILEQLSQ